MQDETGRKTVRVKGKKYKKPKNEWRSKVKQRKKNEHHFLTICYKCENDEKGNLIEKSD